MGARTRKMEDSHPIVREKRLVHQLSESNVLDHNAGVGPEKSA